MPLAHQSNAYPYEPNESIPAMTDLTMPAYFVGWRVLDALHNNLMDQEALTLFCEKYAK